MSEIMAGTNTSKIARESSVSHDKKERVPGKSQLEACSQNKFMILSLTN